MPRFQHVRNKDVITANGPVADHYDRHPQWRLLSEPEPDPKPQPPKPKPASKTVPREN